MNEYLYKNNVKNKNVNKNINFNSSYNSSFYKNEINIKRQEIILLKTKLSENELLINQFNKTINSLKTKYSKEINNFHKYINILNTYLLIIYEFFNNIAKNYCPELLFNYKSNDNNFELIDIKEFQEKINIIENYISSLNKNIIEKNNNINNENNYRKVNVNALNFGNIQNNFKNNINNVQYYNSDYPLYFNKNQNLLTNSFNNNIDENSNEKYPDENNIIYSSIENESIINFEPFQLYKNLENKFDMLAKEIEEAKRNKFDYKIETEIKLNNNRSLINRGSTFSIEKKYLTENLNKEEKNNKNRSYNKIFPNKYPSSGLNQKKTKKKKNRDNYISNNKRNKTAPKARKIIKNK